MIHSDVKTFIWDDAAGVLQTIDQLALPGDERFVSLHDAHEVAEAISSMLVRGAPAIGIAAAFGMYFSARDNWGRPDGAAAIESDRLMLAATRPTAVNLFWALERMASCISSHIGDDTPAAVLAEARAIWDEDVAMNAAMAEVGADELVGAANILTHCNAGALATGGLGTALGVIRAVHARRTAAGMPFHVWADETRPYLQGARLTSWELHRDGIDCTLITDNMAAYFMRQGLVDAIVVGADRITANCDVANKIGTYGLAVLAKHHGIPFYIAAPTSTFDPSIATGDDIVIEERSADEVTTVRGMRIAPVGINVRHPAFDVTPHELITGIITPDGVIRPK